MMDKNQLKKLAGIPVINEKQWSGDVETSKRPPEGLFATGTKHDIITWLKESHKEFKSAMSALNFFINRAGKNLNAERKELLESCKAALRKAYDVKEELESGIDISKDITLTEDWEGKINYFLEKMKSNARITGRKITLSSLEAQRLKNMCKDAKISCPEITIEEDVQQSEIEFSKIIKTLAEKAEGKTGNELAKFISEVYAAGKRDTLTESEKNFSFSVKKEDDAGWMATALAQEGFTVDMTFGDTFYFNFKTKAAKDEALEFVKKKEVEAVDTSEK